jgi:carbon-monoxide dehydrogenase medium subunit/2-furoyl-CoA dehydrogenase FAD binding subunit
MRSAPFEYFAPRSTDELWSVLDKFGDEAKILAGGQSLIALMNLRFVTPEALVDLKYLPHFSGISRQGSTIRIGATATQRSVEANETIKNELPIVALATRSIGHPQIRNRGTFGGSLAHADPSSELPAAVMALDCTLVLESKVGERIVRAIDFFTGPYTTVLQAGEVLKEIFFPSPSSSTQYGFYEIARSSGAFAMAGAICATRVSDSGFVESIRIGLFGVGSKPLLFVFDEEILGMQLLGPELISLVSQIVRDKVEPLHDMQVSSDQRRHYSAVVVSRALQMGLVSQ